MGKNQCGLGFDVRLYDIAMKRIAELEQEIIYARRAEIANEQLIKDVQMWKERAKRFGWLEGMEDD